MQDGDLMADTQESKWYRGKSNVFHRWNDNIPICEIEKEILSNISNKLKFSSINSEWDKCPYCKELTQTHWVL